MNPHDFLDVASDLVSGTREADWRSGVSRAYYSVFHTACLLLKRCGFVVPESDRGHAYIWLRLSNCGHAVLQQIGHNLQDLRRQRNRADYTLDRPFPEAKAVDDFNLAYDLIRLLEPIVAASGSIGPVVQTIRDYERNVLGEVTWQGLTFTAGSNGGATDGA